MEKNLSGAFRRRLHEEVQHWVAEGVISPDQAAALDARYDLKEAAKPRISAFAAVLYGFAALLIGGGLIALVAANLGNMPDFVKVGGLLTLMVLFQAVGYYWWKGPRPAMGHAFLLLGVVLFGANVGLIGQIFPVDGRWYAGFGAWAFACALIAYVTGSVPVALLGIFAAGTNLFGAIFDGVDLWSAPVLAGFQAIPFAIFYRSRITLFAGLILFTMAMVGSAANQENGLLAMSGWLIAAALFAVSSHTLLSSERNYKMGRAMQLGSLLCAVPALFLLSISFIANELDGPWRAFDGGGTISALLTGLFGVLCIIWTGPLFINRDKAPGEIPFILTIMISSAVAIAALASQSSQLIWLVGGAGLLAVSLMAIWHGLNHRLRGLYTLGMLTLGFRLMLFFLFVNSGLAVKAMMMVLSGVALLAATLQFERWAARIEARAGEASA